MRFDRKDKVLYFYLIVMCLSFFGLLLQAKKQINFNTYFLHQRMQRNNDIYSELTKVNAKMLELQKQNEYFNKYKEIYDKIGRNKVKSLLEIKSISNNQNGRYIIAKVQKDVQLNDLVVDKDNILVGRVVVVQKDAIKIQMITDTNSNIPVSINGMEGIIYGTNSKKCQIALQNLTNVKPNQDDLVLTRGTDNLITSGIIVGKIDIQNGKFCVDNKNINHINNLAVIY